MGGAAFHFLSFIFEPVVKRGASTVERSDVSRFFHYVLVPCCFFNFLIYVSNFFSRRAKKRTFPQKHTVTCELRRLRVDNVRRSQQNKESCGYVVINMKRLNKQVLIISLTQRMSERCLYGNLL